jgi:malonyl CoA-acyl carrier protein transacylase
MGRALAEKSSAARELFERADAVLGRRLSEICFDGPEELLRQTINTQPAIMTVSLACLATAKERGDLDEKPSFVAGHSLGEYTAAVAGGALSFEDGLLLVQERGRLMQAAGEENAGGMIAVLGLDEAVRGKRGSGLQRQLAGANCHRRKRRSGGQGDGVGALVWGAQGDPPCRQRRLPHQSDAAGGYRHGRGPKASVFSRS